MPYYIWHPESECLFTEETESDRDTCLLADGCCQEVTREEALALAKHCGIKIQESSTMPVKPLSANTTRIIAGQILAELHNQELDARGGKWDMPREERIRSLANMFKARCDIKDADAKPLGYTDNDDPFAEVSYGNIAAATADVWALKAGCR